MFRGLVERRALVYSDHLNDNQRVVRLKGVVVVGQYTSALEREIVDMRAQHESFVRTGAQWSLRALFSTPECDIAEYCRGFAPSPFGTEACAEVERICRAQSIWLEPGGPHYNSMTPYLHPGAVTAERLTIIGLFNAILFWLNDTVGREKFGHLDSAEQERARLAADRMCRLLESGTLPGAPSSLETATQDFLARLSGLAEPRWLEEFLKSTVEHLRTAIRDQNARSRGDILSVAEYIDLRAEVSGMYPAIALCEFGRDAYLPWERLTEAGIADDLRRLRVLTAEIGALMNDMFSFEKECIVDRSDFNLIPICLLNRPGAGLAEAVHEAAEIVRDRLDEFRSLHDRVVERYAGVDGDIGAALRVHLADLVACVQATWVWQLTTSRYKGASVFEENTPS